MLVMALSKMFSLKANSNPMSISEEPIDWHIDLNEFMRSQLFSQIINGKYDAVHSRNHRIGGKMNGFWFIQERNLLMSKRET